MFLSSLYSQTTPSPSPSSMNGYAGCPRLTGAIPCARASAHEIRPFLLVSHWVSAAPPSRPPCGVLDRGATGDGGAVAKIMAVELHPAKIRSRAVVSMRSIVRPYFSRTPRTRPANQHLFKVRIHAAASRSFFAARLTSGEARVIFNRSLANARFVASSAAHSPESCASLRATICSMSVSVGREKVRPE